MEDIANRPKCPGCGALSIVGAQGWEHPYPHCQTILTHLSDHTDTCSCLPGWAAQDACPVHGPVR